MIIRNLSVSIVAALVLTACGSSQGTSNLMRADGVSNGVPPAPVATINFGDDNAKALIELLKATGVQGKPAGFNNTEYTASLLSCRDSYMEAVGPGGSGWLQIERASCAVTVEDSKVLNASDTDAKAIVATLIRAGVKGVASGGRFSETQYNLKNLRCDAGSIEAVGGPNGAPFTQIPFFNCQYSL